MSTTSTNATTNTTSPIVTRDPRFTAGRNLVKKGLVTEGGIEIFATLVEEATAKYGESSIEIAPAYYEYGNALLRAAQSALAAAEEEDGDDEEGDDDGDKKIPATGTDTKAREAAAAAAERRLKQESSNGAETTVKEEEDTKKEPESSDGATKTEDEEAAVKEEEEATAKDSNEDNETAAEENAEEEEEEGSDLELALEMMENAFSIMEECNSNASSSEPKEYKSWVEEQLPRVLTGLGDALSTLSRHADAADAYSRALELRRTLLESRYGTEEKSGNPSMWFTVEHLQARRQIVEATIFIAEELLSCDPDQDVITTETSSLIVKAEERVEYARGYYDKARDALQETVLLMGQLAARYSNWEGVTVEKENVCFIATLVMGVGTTLATIDEEKEAAAAEAAAAAGGAPPAKKAKKS